jgi:hypothetical protein
VELLFDGGRVQVRAEGRIAQTVDASERQLGTVDGRACLRFGSGKRLAVVCAGETPAEVDPGAPLDASSADRVVLPTSGWAALHEAVIAPERKRQRRQELRDRRRAEKERRQRPK